MAPLLWSLLVALTPAAEAQQPGKETRRVIRDKVGETITYNNISGSQRCLEHPERHSILRHADDLENLGVNHLGAIADDWENMTKVFVFVGLLVRIMDRPSVGAEIGKIRGAGGTSEEYRQFATDLVASVEFKAKRLHADEADNAGMLFRAVMERDPRRPTSAAAGTWPPWGP